MSSSHSAEFCTYLLRGDSCCLFTVENAGNYINLRVWLKGKWLHIMPDQHGTRIVGEKFECVIQVVLVWLVKMVLNGENAQYKKKN